VMRTLSMMVVAIGVVCNACYAETIRLKNGRSFTGPIIERSSDYVVIFYHNVPLKYSLDQIEAIDEVSGIDANDSAAQERLKSVEAPGDSEISIPLHPPAEFDFKTKFEIYSIRRESVLQGKEFVPAGYTPSEAVFGQIQDNQPWWGLVGLSSYGISANSIAGASEESRFILNPLLLVGIDHSWAYTKYNSSVPAVALYPGPVMLYWDTSGKAARVVYNVASFWSAYTQYYPDRHDEYHQFTLIAYNARDLGCSYISIAADDLKNVDLLVAPGTIHKIKQFIHSGGSCGYPGGCNNMSPFQREMEIVVRQLPARIRLKLWRSIPTASHNAPDMVFTIDMI
jgi:hypothetical protein